MDIRTWDTSAVTGGMKAHKLISLYKIYNREIDPSPSFEK